MDETTLRAHLEARDWRDIHARLRDFATHRSGSKEQGKDLAQAAIARVFAHDSKWDPETSPDLTRYLMSVVNSLLANERAGAAAQRNVSLARASARARAQRVADDGALSEASAVTADLFARRTALLKERLAGDAAALQLLGLLVEGVDTPADIGKATGWSAHAAAATRRRMQRAAAGVARDVGGDEAAHGFADGDEDERDDQEVA